jgi:phosphatidate phosphatase PAH1
MWKSGLVICFCASIGDVSSADNNFLTGANDVIAVVDDDGDVKASPFNVQFGKKDIWLPRAGHVVSLEVNNIDVPVGMVLDSAGQAYFPTLKTDGSSNRQYRFWTALLGMGNPSPNHRTNSATVAQLAKLGLRMGANPIVYRVTTATGTLVTTSAVVHLLNNTARIVVSDIDGTVTKSNIRGMILPALGLSDWKHKGVVELYQKIAEQGYTILYLSNRAIGQSDMTREYIYSLKERPYTMPRGPVLLQVESLLGAFKTEVIKGQPEVNKIAALSRVKGLFPGNPFYSGFGNKAWDILAYKALNMNPDLIFNVEEDSRLISEGTGIPTNYTSLTDNILSLYPLLYV